MKRPSNKEILDRIVAFEHSVAVDEWRAGGLRVWPIVRIDLAYRLRIPRVGAIPVPSSGPRRWARTLASVALRFGERSIRHQAVPFDPTADVIFLSGEYNRREEVNGAWFDVVQDPLAFDLESAGHRVTTWERVVRGRGPAPKARATCPYWPIEPVLTGLIEPRSWCQPNQPLRSEWSVLLSTFADVLGDEHPGENAPWSLEWVSTRAAHVLRLKRWFARQLLASRARHCLLVNYWSTEGYALTLACRSRGIRVYEVQHGGGGPEHHPAYGRFERQPRDGYDVIPDHFLCWDDSVAGAIKSWGERVGREASVIGPPWLGYWNRPDAPHVLEAQRRVQDAGLGHRNALVTFQPRSFEEVLPVVTQAAKLSPQVKWWFRLHPRLKGSSIANLFRKANLPSNVAVKEASELPLYALLRVMDHHITAFSTVTLEAARFGVPTAVLLREGLDYFANEVASGFVAYCANPQQLAEQVAHTGRREPLATSGEVSVVDVLRGCDFERPLPLPIAESRVGKRNTPYDASAGTETTADSLAEFGSIDNI